MSNADLIARAKREAMPTEAEIEAAAKEIEALWCRENQDALALVEGTERSDA